MIHLQNNSSQSIFDSFGGLINKSQSGLIKSKKILKDFEEIKIIEFDHNDVVRHPLVSKIIRAYQKKNLNDQD